jgi:hypothetical protein
MRPHGADQYVTANNYKHISLELFIHLTKFLNLSRTRLYEHITRPAINIIKLLIEDAATEEVSVFELQFVLLTFIALYINLASAFTIM